MNEDKPTSAVVILSGGLDSTALLYHLYYDLHMEIKSCVSFNYGQRHKKELDYARNTCEKLGIVHHIIDLWSSGFTDAIAPSGSSLVSDTDVPEGHYAAENMKLTVVPNRNMVMLAIAGAIAVAEGADCVATGVHAGDHAIYPDCRPNFIQELSYAMYLGNKGFGLSHGVIAPFVFMTKEDIAYVALKNGVKLAETWSCYKGGEIHCGKCGTCVERLEAIHGASMKFAEEHPYIPPLEWIDRTLYEDEMFWKEALKEEVK